MVNGMIEDGIYFNALLQQVIDHSDGATVYEIEGSSNNVWYLLISIESIKFSGGAIKRRRKNMERL